MCEKRAVSRKPELVYHFGLMSFRNQIVYILIFNEKIENFYQIQVVTRYEK